MNYSLIFGSMRVTVTVLAFIVLIKYYLYLLLAPFYSLRRALDERSLRRKIAKGIIKPEYKPLVSVIIPAWNEEVGIVTTIKSVLAGSYRNIEIVVVNDGSRDGTERKIKALKREYDKSPLPGKTLKCFSKKRGGKGSALNYGIRNSKGKIVMTMDGDSAHDKKAVENLVKYFQDPSVDAVVGNVKISNNRTLIGMLQKLEYIFGFYFKRVHSLFNAEYIFGGACAAFRRTATFDKIGYFDTGNKTEDIEYSMRTKLYGLKSVYAEDAITYTEGASDLRGLYKQRLRWKKGRLDTFRKYSKLFLSVNPKHSKFLSWFVLPFAIFGEIQMFFEPMFFSLIWAYTFISGDYLSIGLSSLFIFFTFFAAILLGDKKTNPLYIFLFPSFWILFYGIVAVEFLALVKSIEMIFNAEDVAWQNWSRKGVEEGIKIKMAGAGARVSL